MDYSPDNCLNMFTNGQINVMRNVLEIARPELINEEAVVTTEEIIAPKKHLIQTHDILGRNSSKKGLNINIYDDGSVEKIYQIK
jgi:hypothetical protein